MNVARFYGKERAAEFEAKSQQISSNIEATTTARRLPKIEYSILAPSSRLKTFYKQDEAIQYKSEDDFTLVFSFEYSTGGVRKFLAGSAATFWEHYSNLSGSRHHYEVVVEERPCKLYLDIEFKRMENPEKDGDLLVNALLADLNAFILNNLQINVSKEDVLLLDSTSPNKFSNHAIFSNVVFGSNQSMGKFVNNFLASLKTEQRELYTVQKGACTELIVDTAVYTRNRNFRMYLSCKYGKQQYLTVSENDLFSAKLKVENSRKENCDIEKEIFLASLVTYLPNKKTVKIIQFDESDTQEHQNERSFSKPLSGTPRRQSSGGSRARLSNESSSSPFEEIDKFVQKIVEPGFIRKWSYFQSSSLLVYEIGGNRFCGSIGREHKSNNIKFVCNTVEGVLHQRCHDPLCSEYRGPPIHIPKNLLPWTEMDEWNGDPDDQKDAAKDPEEGSKDEAMGDTKKRRTEEDGVCGKMLRVDDLEEEEDCDRGQSSQDEESQFCDQLAGKSTSHFKGLSQEIDGAWTFTTGLSQSSQLSDLTVPFLVSTSNLSVNEPSQSTSSDGNGDLNESDDRQILPPAKWHASLSSISTNTSDYPNSSVEEHQSAATESNKNPVDEEETFSSDDELFLSIAGDNADAVEAEKKPGAANVAIEYRNISQEDANFSSEDEIFNSWDE